MPELPEVETVCRGLSPFMVGRVIENFTCHRQNLRNNFPPMFAERVNKQTVVSIFRRGKYILVRLKDYTWVMHLGMSGRIQRSLAKEYLHQKHDHVTWQVDDVVFAFNDPRRFGDMDLVISPLDYLPIKNMAPEPFDISIDDFHKRLQNTSRPLKTSLLDQSIIAGLGNIYVCEALWKSGLSPFKVSDSVTFSQTAVLLRNIIDVLESAIEAGGSTLRDHRAVDGTLGYFQHQLKVYGQELSPCSTSGCAGRIGRAVQSGRSTYYCNVCQKI